MPLSQKSRLAVSFASTDSLSRFQHAQAYYTANILSRRTRRIKCDEVKPFCNRCKKAGWKCKYSSVKDAVRSRQPRAQEVHPSPTTAHPPLSPSSEMSPPVGSSEIIRQQVRLQPVSVPYCQPAVRQSLSQNPFQDLTRGSLENIEPPRPQTTAPQMSSDTDDEGYDSASNASDTQPIDPSLSEFVWENKRRYHSKSCFPQTL